jgi:two-component system sensor histidine kinase QseC
MVVAGDSSEMERTLARIGWLLALVCGTATLASAGSMIWIVRRGLKPVDVLAGKIGRMDDSNLGQRLDLDGTPSELMPVTQRLNELLGRLEEAFSREKSFSSDVAHELRTPLAGVEAALEVCASRPRKPEEYQQTIGRCLDAARRMHGMVDNLLMLARVESHQVKITCEVVAIADLLDECWRLFAARAGERSLHVQFHVEPQCHLRTDREKLRLILHNLLDNAVNYANAGGSIQVKVGRSGDRLTLCISNSGNCLSKEQAEHVFERFWRGDAARAATGAHCGLGLTLCRRIVELLDGSIAVRCEQAGDFSIVLAFAVQAGVPDIAGVL